MPNNVTNHVVIHGDPEVLDEIQRVLMSPNPDGGPRFDFEGVLPMPEELARTSDPVQIFDTQEEVDAFLAERAGFQARMAAAGLARGDEILAITAAEAARLGEEYGALTWYGWATRNWGTKWNAYVASAPQRVHEEWRQVPDFIYVSFQTAWAQPVPVLEAIEERWGATVHAVSFDEGARLRPIIHGDPWGFLNAEVRITV